jgi:hypothetical protein
MGPRIDRVDKSGGTVVTTAEDQMKDVLNNPRLGENAKVAELEKIIAKMPDTEKMELYDRVKNRKSQDPLAQQLHYRLSHSPNGAGQLSTTDQVLKALNPKHGEATSTTTPTPSGTTAAKDPTRAVDLKGVGNVAKDTLQNTLQKISKGDFGDGLLEIAKGKGDPSKKLIEMRGFLEGMSPAALKKVIEHSDKWPSSEKRLFNEALGTSEKLMKRIATELTPDEQLKMLNRALDTSNILKGTQWREGINAWMDAVSNPTLNRAIEDVPQLSFLIGDRIKKSGDSTVLTRLTSQKKIDVLELAFDSLKDSKVDAKAAQGLTMAFSAMTPKEKNKVIDDMQRGNPDELPNFLKMSAPYVDHILLDGINKENAAFIRKAYQFMEAHAATQPDKDLYGKLSLFMEGWMEEAYKRR